MLFSAKRHISLCVCTCVALGIVYMNGVASAFVSAAELINTKEEGQILSEDTGSYFNYYEKYHNEKRAQSEIKLSSDNIISADNIDSAISNSNDNEGNTVCYLGEENTYCEWIINAEETGVYSACFDYMALEGTGKDIEISLSIDGVVPYKEAENLILTRLWEDEFKPSQKKDAVGNDLRPRQVEKQAWQTLFVYNSMGMYNEPYLFYLSEGKHSIRFTIKRESVFLKSITFKNDEKSISYKEYIASFGEDADISGEPVLLEAENAYEKSSQMLYPTYDRTTPATSPNSPYVTRLNTIGQSNWNEMGQAITWKVSVPKAGLYGVRLRVRQNFNQGMTSYRSLLVNGKCPFEEAYNLKFSYNSDWYVQTIGDEENPYYIYLKDGDLLSLRCEAGELGEVYRDINQAVLSLNEIYRKIIVVTGASPDIYRDYNLENHVPDLLDTFSELADSLRKITKSVVEVNGKEGSQTATLNEMADMLSDFVEQPHTIPERLSKFKVNVESMGSLLLSFGEQPLEIDYMAFVPISDWEDGKDIVTAKANLVSKLSFNTKKFFSSFVTDYKKIGNAEDGKDTINVWISTGRDQALIISNLIESSFTANTNIPVKVSMVDTGETLMKASLAGKGPDAALMVGETYPVNLAMRGALVDLSDPKYGIDDTFKGKFYASAWTPFYYNGGLYALPETQSFNMMFYRTDILEQLNIEVPQTWEEFLLATRVLQSNNLQSGILEIGANAGISASINIFDALLFQNGGDYYNESLTKTRFDENAAIVAFEKWSEFYTKHGLPREFNLYNRFRTGEMPLAISGIGLYNTLMAAAPEITGLWKMAPIPGTLKEDGKIDRSVAGSGNGCIMLKSAVKNGVDVETAEFLKWWVSAEAQTQYGYDLESTMGIASRYYPACKEAFENMRWSYEERNCIIEQWEWVRNIPQIPGNYLVERSLTNAVRSVITKSETPSRMLSINNKEINEEITRKRKEFHLD